MRVMILGAGGYLGRKMVSCLGSQHSVTGVYRKIPEEPGGIKAVEANMEDIQSSLGNEQYDWVINCAAVYEHEGTAVHEIVDANMIFALRVLDCAMECGVRNFLTIDTSLPKGLNLYSFTKKQFAEFGEFYAGKYGLTFVNVLLEMFYGGDEPEGRFLSGVCRKMVKGEDLDLTVGTQKRDIIYIDDVCHAIELILESNMKGFCNIPLGSGEAVPVRRIIEYMHGIICSVSKLNFGVLPTRDGEPDCVANPDVLSSIGFVPKYSWKEGLRLLCEKIRTEA